MRFMATGLLIAITCTACSGDDIQLDLEKVESQNSEVDDASKNRVFAEAEDVANKQMVLASSERLSESDNVASVLNNTPSIKNVDAEVEYNSRITADLVQQLEVSLAEIDDAEVMGNYGAGGSGVNLLGGALELKNYSVSLNTETLSLQNNTLALAISTRDLVSEIRSISGARSIKGNPSGFGFTIDLSGDYLFEFDKDTLTEKAKTALQSIVTLYQKHDGVGIDIAGHTDSKGSSDYNFALSERRAKSVKQWFKSAGISTSLITTKGYGETQPVAPNTKNNEDYPDGRMLNRRVNITVKTKDKVAGLPIDS